MNVLLVIPSNIGTIASVSFNLYRGLCNQKNLTVYVACLGEYRDEGFKFDNLYKLGERNHGISKILSRVFELKKIKKERNIDISIATLLGAIYWNVLSGIGEKKIGLFHTRLSQQKYYGRLNYWIHYLADKFLCERLDKMIAVNKSAYCDLNKLHKKKSGISLVYNTHNFDEIRNLSQEKMENEFEQELFKHQTILYVGSLNSNIKGTDRLLRSFVRVHEIYPTYKLVYVGGDVDGSLASLEDNVEKFGLSDSVYFLGCKRNPYKYMKSADLLVSPSRDEGLPGVIIESLSLGTKVVATNSSMGIWEIMQCDKQYDESLDKLYETSFGFITPNILDDEDKTVDYLSQGICKCIEKEYNIKVLFDKSRFSEESVIPHFIK
jgi:glycosyltransferase involved in cell wall biosynthesis